jgi:hypothetical protein
VDLVHVGAAAARTRQLHRATHHTVVVVRPAASSRGGHQHPTGALSWPQVSRGGARWDSASNHTAHARCTVCMRTLQSHACGCVAGCA